MSHDDLSAGRPQLSAAKRALLEKRLRNRMADMSSARVIPKGERRDQSPLSFAQQRLWFIDQLAPGSPAYNIPTALRLRGQLDVPALARSLAEIIRRHESLRTTFTVYANQQPLQTIAPQLALKLPLEDLCEWPETEREAEAARRARAEAQRPFDLESGPLVRARLLRLSREEHVLLFTMHHIVSDGWSMGVLVREVAALYEAFVLDQESPLPELPVQYADFALWQREWLQGEVLDQQLAYWRQQLGGELPPLLMPTDWLRPATQSFRGAHEPFRLPKNLSDELKQLGQHEGATLFMTLLAAFQVLLCRYTGQEDLTVGSPIANRNSAETENLIGFFVNTLALRTNLSGDPTFRELLRRVRDVALGAYVHQDLPFEKLVEELHPERDLSRNPLFQVMFVLQNAPLDALELRGLTIRAEDFGGNATRFDLEFHLFEVEDGLSGYLTYSVDLFKQETIGRFLDRYAVLLERVLSNPDGRLSELTFLTEAERRQVLQEWSGERSSDSNSNGNGGSEDPRSASITRLFEEQVAQSPEAIAIIFDDQRLTFSQLNARANQLAHYLSGMGVGPETTVGLCLERSLELIVALLGILKAGGAYVPLDASYPSERLRFMIQDAGLTLLVSQRKFAELLPAAQAQTILLDQHWPLIARQSERDLVVQVNAENLAYIMYTSGSTGQSKGVCVPHRAVIRLVKRTTYAEFGPEQVFLQLAPVSFDASTFEIWGSLLNGARLVIMPPHPPSLEEIGRGVRLHGVTTLWLTAGLFQQMVDYRLGDLPSLRQMLAGGDVLSVGHVLKFLRELPGTTLINGYGPTENCTFTCCHVMKREIEETGSVPIGRPISHTQVYILDQHLKPVAPGLIGELYAGGDGLARGYVARPELTAEKFIPHPFSAAPGARLYRTGDLARYLADGAIEFCGRMDQQVKLRGFRVEPEEIEAVLVQHEEVGEAIVVVRDDAHAEKHLVAYVVRRADKSEAAGFIRELAAQRVSQWQQLYDETYQHTSAESERDFNITGWNSSYTGAPIPAEEMREWRSSTVERILRLSPRRALEIGCGTGLLLSQIAPLCEEYWGTDFSSVSLDRIKRESAEHDSGLAQVKLLQRTADDFADLPSAFFDTIILNSVVQYFPHLDYLRRVLEGAFEVLRPGGSIFLGDVRNHRLMDAFHTSVQLYRASSSLGTEMLRQHVREAAAEEEELLVDPAFFTALKRSFPQLDHAIVYLKRGRYHNELMRFRYDVLLRRAGAELRATLDALDWQHEGMTPEALRQLLIEGSPEHIGFRRVPNARVMAEVRAAQLLVASTAPPTVGELRQVLSSGGQKAVDPSDLWAIGDELAYSVDVLWSDADGGASFDVIFQRRAQALVAVQLTGPESTPERTGSPARPDKFANNPLHGVLAQSLSTKLRGYLSEKLPAYMVPAHILMLDELPLTPNGKVDRRALPPPGQVRNKLSESYVAPRTPIEELLARIWLEVLKGEGIGINDDFFELGGHSLLATQLLSRVRESFAVDLPLRSLFESPTIAGLARHVEVAMRAEKGIEAQPIVPVPRDGSLPLSFSQQRLWFMNELEPSSSAYNIPTFVRLKGSLNHPAMERALSEIVMRHESLRTSFGTRDGQPVQVIAAPREMSLPVLDLSHLPETEREAEARRLAAAEASHSFDLTHGPLLRAELLRLATDEHVLLLTMHHIISDGWSMNVLVREVGTLYRAFAEHRPSPLPPLPIQYADFAYWQQHHLAGEVLESHLKYWKRQLGGMLPKLELPTDRPRPLIQSFRGASRTLNLPASLSEKLKALAQREGVTLFMLLLAGFNALLYRYTGQEDIVIGSPIANRNRVESEGLIGFFVNTLVLRTNVSGAASFRELLKRVRGVALEAYAHQDMPFEHLVDELHPERSMSRNPLFQVMFQLENTPKEEVLLPGLALYPVEGERVATQFDLSLDLMESEDGILAVAEYSTDLFDAETIRRMLRHYRTLLEGAAASPELSVAALPLLTSAERERLLVQWNDKEKAYPASACVQELFEAQVERTPQAVAVVGPGERLTYEQLNARVNQLAHYLKGLGVAPEMPVGVMMERSVEMLVALLAVLKAGGAYVPLDPRHPPRRLAFMLEDAQALVLLTEEGLRAVLAEHSAQVVCVDTARDLIARHSRLNPVPAATPANLAYVIYTSGSTGQPKGVCVAQEALLNHHRAIGEEYALSASDVVLQFASLSFDVAAEEIFPTLLSGAAIVLRDEQLDLGTGLLRQIERDRVSVMNLPVSAWREWVDELSRTGQSVPDCVRLLVVGSERVSRASFSAWQEVAGNRAILLNAYGTTETTITNTLYQTAPGAPEAHAGPSLPIGRPLANTQVYLLDQRGQLVPIGVTGELHVGGDALARGYLGRSDSTAERFLPHPFSQRAGARLYRTGDLARYLPDGNIEFLGRADQQVKIRGYRIEPGEIEAALIAHPLINEALVINREDGADDGRLVGYLTLRPLDALLLDQPIGPEMEAEHLAQWRMVHDDEVFNETAGQPDAAFNISGWNSSYTGTPIPAEEMREWVDDAVEQLLSLRPQRILEIGCGTGLLLFRLAEHCAEYVGTDFSRAALDYVRQRLETGGGKLWHVALRESSADDFSGFETASFDLLILNSVVQYFPGVDYLLRVLKGAARVVAPGGSIFIGDVRSLPLLEAFYTSVELHRADDDLTIEQLRQRVRKRVAQEEELVLDPAFFLALREQLPQLSHVEITPKRGRSHNEMTRFRYQVTLHLKKDAALHGGEALGINQTVWLDWEREDLSLRDVRLLLEESGPGVLALAGVPNGRVAADVKALELSRELEGGVMVKQLRESLKGLAEQAPDPEAFWELSRELPYEVRASWARHGFEGRLDLLFSRRGAEHPGLMEADSLLLPGSVSPARSLGVFTNNPLQGSLARRLSPQLKSFLKGLLPDYMIPTSFIVLDELPLMPNGKVDQDALPSPDAARPELQEGFVAPRNALEEAVAGLWSDLLGMERVGVRDNFFELGGHSLMATQLISRFRELFQVEIPLRIVFEQPTVAGLAAHIEQARRSTTTEQSPVLVPRSRQERRMKRSVKGLTPDSQLR